MTATTKTTLKGYFNADDVPTEAQFANLIDSSEPSFCPVDYGAAGDGVTDDTAILQATIEAASTAGGGTIKLNGKSYVVGLGGTRQIAGYTTDYGIWINHENVFIQGPGTLILATTPASTKYTMVLFGNGGAAGSWPEEGGTWIDHVGIRDVVIDATAISAVNRGTINGMMSGGIMFAYCRYFITENNTIKNAWGYGSIHSNVCSRYGVISNNNILDCVGNAIAAEGPRYVRFINNYIRDAAQTGIELNANLDNIASGVSHHNTISNNIIDGYATVAGGAAAAIILRGVSDSVISDNYVHGDYSRCVGIYINAFGTAGCYKSESLRNTITGNYFYSSVECSYWLQLVGQAANPFDGTNLTVANNTCNSNTAINYISAYLDVYVQNNNIINNNFELWSPSAILDATSTGNRLYPNTQPIAINLTQNSATPTIGYALMKTNNSNPTTITALLGGYAGAKVTILIKDANTTIDFTGTDLEGNAGVDWSPANGDYMDCVSDGTNWYCDVHDVTA